MVAPGAITLLSPVIVGFLFGPEVLGGLLAGITVSGVLMGIFQNNAGGAWDNAKKSFEKGVQIDGETYYKKSEPHKASVTGDTVGDPFKDTSGPSMNILIKLSSIVSLIIAPYIVGIGATTEGNAANGGMKKECCAGMNDTCGSKSSCDMSVCATMTKEQCAAYCDSIGCDSACKADCLKQYDANGKFIGGKGGCCKKSSASCCKDGQASGANKACCKDKAASSEKKACCKDGEGDAHQHGSAAGEKKACCSEKEGAHAH
jgi:K(+)-stimulated pyrophosphate-energized sodium pump